DYKNAMQSFISYINRSQKKDYFYWLARTYVAECLYQMNYFEQAINELTELFYSDELQTEIKANVVLKLSEIYCKEKEMEKARYYFELYKTILPNTTSIESLQCK
ncbi:MAG: tetratricopeptide repeat protein, partial [Candidatus Kapaibacteriota bacterium]